MLITATTASSYPTVILNYGKEMNKNETKFIKIIFRNIDEVYCSEYF